MTINDFRSLISTNVERGEMYPPFSAFRSFFPLYRLSRAQWTSARFDCPLRHNSITVIFVSEIFKLSRYGFVFGRFSDWRVHRVLEAIKIVMTYCGCAKINLRNFFCISNLTRFFQSLYTYTVCVFQSLYKFTVCEYYSIDLS